MLLLRGVPLGANAYSYLATINFHDQRPSPILADVIAQMTIDTCWFSIDNNCIGFVFSETVKIEVCINILPTCLCAWGGRDSLERGVQQKKKLKMSPKGAN